MEYIITVIICFILGFIIGRKKGNTHFGINQNIKVGNYGERTSEQVTKKADIDFSIGDEVLYVGTYVGKVVNDNEVILKDGTKITSLKTQPQKFKKLL